MSHFLLGGMEGLRKGMFDPRCDPYKKEAKKYYYYGIKIIVWQHERMYSRTVVYSYEINTDNKSIQVRRTYESKNQARRSAEKRVMMLLAHGK